MVVIEFLANYLLQADAESELAQEVKSRLLNLAASARSAETNIAADRPCDIVVHLPHPEQLMLRNKFTAAGSKFAPLKLIGVYTTINFVRTF